MNIYVKFLTGLTIALAIAWLARRTRTLSRSGMWAAAVVGTLIMGIGGLGWAVLLMGFFISSSLLSRLFKARKAGLDEKFAKSDERDAGQVFANGGFAALFVLLHMLFPGQNIAWLGFAGALAAANADTWATELGVLSKKPPILITNGTRVERGSSGGVTLIGTAAALGGSTFIGLLTLLFWQGVPLTLPYAFTWLAVISLAGLGGSLVDSLFGATIQAIYHCPHCSKETEKHPLHVCGFTTTLKRGLPWLNNDWVNAFCTLSGALLAVLAATLF